MSCSELPGDMCDQLQENGRMRARIDYYILEVK
jgi:hypothetical protein